MHIFLSSSTNSKREFNSSLGTLSRYNNKMCKQSSITRVKRVHFGLRGFDMNTICLIFVLLCLVIFVFVSKNSEPS